MHFGPLRSLLHSSDPSQTSFDEILRHLLNVSWWEDPRIVEECLAYAEAGLSRWPDITRSLHVSKMEVQFLENIFIWGALLRGVYLVVCSRAEVAYYCHRYSWLKAQPFLPRARAT